jgi:hypothetical protein
LSGQALIREVSWELINRHRERRIQAEKQGVTVRADDAAFGLALAALWLFQKVEVEPGNSRRRRESKGNAERFALTGAALRRGCFPADTKK